MEYRNLGKSGLRVSSISLGSWLTFGQSVDDETTETCMKAAFEAGVNYFDGAEAYGDGAAEEAMGRVFRKMDWPRDALVISGKVSSNAARGATRYGQNRKHLVEACDQALQRMGLEYLDLFFCHRPDPSTPLEETVLTMNELIRRGKIFYWGTSEFTPADLLEMHAIADRNGMIGPLMEQTGYNMFGRTRMERDLLPLFEKHGMGSTVYSPLAGGILTGKYDEGIPEESRIGRTDADWLRRSLTEEKVEKTRELTAIADELGCSMAQLALAWVLKNPNVSTAITGATRPEHVRDNVQAVEVVGQLTEEVIEQIEQILDNKP
ncbi:MAG: aldo/keto reductase [Armatimonadota bacterium]|jgi:voltage-dependent potassium channel beta subunit